MKGMRRLFRSLTRFAALLGLVAGPVGAGLEEGPQAYGRGDCIVADQARRPPADHGAATARSRLDQMRADGRALPPDAREVRVFRSAAERGVATAQYQLGLRYATGRGVPQDYTEAVRWYRRAAEQGLAPAQYQLGLRYANGEGIERDYALAVKWYRRAAAQGVAFAQFNLGVRYANGQGVERDPALAYLWFSIAARGLWGREAETARQARDAIKGALSPAQINATDELVKAWRPEPEPLAPSAARP